MEPVIIAVVTLSILSPIIGSAIGIMKMPSNLFMYNMLSFAAAIMLSISFLELIPEAIEYGSLTLTILGLAIGT